MHHDRKKLSTATALSGTVIALTAASLFSVAQAGPSSASEEGIIHCAGVNACKGQGRCGTADHSCKGANACNGQGILPMTAKDCAAKGGKPKELPGASSVK